MAPAPASATGDASSPSRSRTDGPPDAPRAGRIVQPEKNSSPAGLSDPNTTRPNSRAAARLAAMPAPMGSAESPTGCIVRDETAPTQALEPAKIGSSKPVAARPMTIPAAGRLVVEMSILGLTRVASSPALLTDDSSG